MLRSIDIDIMNAIIIHSLRLPLLPNNFIVSVLLLTPTQ